MGTSSHFANIFTDANYNGQVRYITRTGWYIISGEFTGFNNNISSITTSMLNNVRVILFSDESFGGTEYVVENDLPQLPATMNNQCSSMIVEYKTENHVQLFEHADFGGLSKTLYGIEYPRLNDFLLNNKLSSIKVPLGTEVHLYENDGFQGRRIMIDKDTSFIGSDINDRISSLRVYRFPIAYSDIHFKGRSQVLEFADRYSAGSQGPPVRTLKIGDNAIRSLKVPYPFGVLAYDNNNFSGEHVFYKHDVEGISQNISSLSVLPGIPFFGSLPGV